MRTHKGHRTFMGMGRAGGGIKERSGHSQGTDKCLIL